MPFLGWALQGVSGVGHSFETFHPSIPPRPHGLRSRTARVAGSSTEKLCTDPPNPSPRDFGCKEGRERFHLRKPIQHAARVGGPPLPQKKGKNPKPKGPNLSASSDSEVDTGTAPAGSRRSIVRHEARKEKGGLVFRI